MIIEERIYTCYCGKNQQYVKMYEEEGLAIQRPILGHLIDSAMTNIRRLIITQYQQNEKIVYAQDEWVKYGA